MKQIFIENYIGKPLEHEYNLDNKDNKLTIIDPYNGNIVSTLIDTGNSIDWVDMNGNTFIFEYHDAIKLLILLTEHNKTKIKFCKFITLKTI